MRHARKDYNRFQDPALTDPSLLSDGSTPIAEDEPVFLLRASDDLAPEVVREWAALYDNAHLDEDDNDDHETVVGTVNAWADEMEAWQRAHRDRVKLPTVPVDQLVTEGNE